MTLLEEALLSLRAKDSVSLVGETYRVKNITSVADGSLLKATVLLYKPEEPTVCVNIEVSTQIYTNWDPVNY